MTQLVEQELPLDGEIVAPGEWTPQEAADHVRQAWQDAVESIVETGRRLIKAKAKVGHGNWLATVALLPFGDATARKLMAIGQHPDLSDRSHVNDLPAAWGTLYVLAQLPPGEIPRRIESGDITPELERATAQQWVGVYAAARQESLNAWSQANDAAIHVLSYLKTYQAPTDTDVYASRADFKRRVLEAAGIVEFWEDA